MKAVDVPVGKDFQLGDGRRYCRVLFEDSPTVIYRCGVNIAALLVKKVAENFIKYGETIKLQLNTVDGTCTVVPINRW